LKNSKSINVHVEFLRIIACIMVIYNHTNERGFYRYVLDSCGSLIWTIDTMISICCKAGVPLFFMISGSNLLGKEETIGKTYSRIWRILICILVWSFFYNILDCYLSNEPIYYETILKSIISKDYWHLWYLYSYVLFILSLPLVRVFAKNLDDKLMVIILTISIITQEIIPIIEELFINISPNLKNPWFCSNIFLFPIVGYYIDKIVDIKRYNSKRIIIAWLLNAISLVLMELMEKNILSGAEDIMWNEKFLQAGQLINAIVLFITIKVLVNNNHLSQKNTNIIISVGGVTFGIYLLHILFLWKIPILMEALMKLEKFTRLGIYLSTIIVFILSGIVTFVVKKIPVLNRIV